MTEAVRPVFTSRPAVLKCSEVMTTPANLVSRKVRMRVRTEKKTPKPTSMASESKRQAGPSQVSNLKT